MFKRIMLFLITNIAVIAVLTIVVFVLENVFGIKFDLYGFNYVSILIYSAVIGFSGSFISLFMSKWMAKRAYKIQLVTKEDYYNLSDKQKVVFEVVENLAERNHIKMPEVGFYSSADANAFATGSSKNNSLVAVSSGLLNLMDKNAIEGVIGHEMAHVLNGDMVTMTLLQGVLNTFVIFLSRVISNIIARTSEEEFSYIAYFLTNIILQIFFGILASMILMKFSRYREFKADAGSAKFVGKEKMIAGLEALKQMKNTMKADKSNFATMKINNKTKKGFISLFSSHPDLDDRINALEKLRV